MLMGSGRYPETIMIDSNDPKLSVQRGGPCSAPTGTWVSDVVLLDSRQHRARRGSTVTSGSVDPSATDKRGSRSAPVKIWTADDPLLTARQSADDLTISLPAFWKGVADGRLPEPFYVLPRAPRWRRSELRAALERNRMLPAEAKIARRKSHRKNF